ncbi:hypothetical protein F1880_009434 [Penicillium rolfsii]|nr:hypothetical protein F1880_009434 [Penicillium rolfsii]
MGSSTSTLSTPSTSTPTQISSTSNTSPAWPTPSDAMMLDDTKHTTYIHDLDRELADIEPPEGGLVILPLAARMISVPESVLSTPSQGRELVLYTEPSSLTVPREQDSVRKAIIESRARARAQAASSHQSSLSSDHGTPSYSIKNFWDSPLTCSIDDDPMDIDYTP